MEYKYAPLAAKDREIRLLTIFRGNPSDDIRISLRHASLPENPKGPKLGPNQVSNATDLPQDPLMKESTVFNATSGPPMPTAVYFEALSYTWGSAEDSRQIYVGGSIISVTNNLYIALGYLRREADDREMWIDAVCIDQSNLAERSQQVSLMGDIYRMAARVVIWLGPEQDDSDHALRILYNTGSRVVVDWIPEIISPSDSEVGKAEQHWGDTSQDLPYDQRDFLAIYHLFGRSWFERLWIRQEVHLASSALLTCGSKTIPWDDFRRAVYCICFKHSAARQILGDLVSGYVKRRYQVLHLCRSIAFNISFETLRFNLRGIKWTDPRDAIYATLNVLQTPYQRLDISPDYTKKTSDVYTDVAVQLLDRLHTLSFLNSCELEGRSQTSMPTWVPDWQTQSRVACIIPRQWSACAWVSAQARYLGQGKLRATGISISKVDQVQTLDVGEDEFQIANVARCIQRLVARDRARGSRADMDKTLETYCRAMHLYCFAEHIHGREEDIISLEAAKETLRLLESSRGIPEEFTAVADDFFYGCFSSFVGRCFISTPEGHKGLAPAGTRPGDYLCVLLGSPEPILLREVSRGPNTWEIVGTCNIPGLMNGEAIYGSQSRYRPIEHKSDSDRIDNSELAFLDQDTGAIKTNPADILAEFGIPVINYERYPHVLHVSPDSLRESGLHLQDFVLV